MVIRRVNRYELLEQVGIGGMAVVYRGRDTALDREVAVKLLHPHLAAKAEARARFSREARAVARLAHPNILEIYDYAGDEAEESYLITEFVRGRTLRAFAESVGFGYPEIGVLVGRALTDALVHAHSAGVIHRDIKPENVLVCEVTDRRSVKLADFGIARILASDERMTFTGALVGSPNHMAPEIIEGREAGVPSDIFSLGTLLYWLVTDRLPFAAPNPTATLRRVIAGEYDDPRLVSPLVSDTMAEVVRRALAPDPAARFASAAELRDALDRVLGEVGLTRADQELSAFLDAPAAYKAGFPKRLVTTLVSQGETAMRAGATARALACYNRVLAIEPEHPVVLAELRRLARLARFRRWVKGAALTAILALVLVAAAVTLRNSARHPAMPPEVPVAQPAMYPAAELPADRPAATPTPPGEPVSVPRAPLAAVQPDRSPTPAVHPKHRETPVELAVHVRPYAQRALLDGVEVARGQQRVSFSLEPGHRHLIQIEHACCLTFTKDVDASEAAHMGELKVPLVPRPAHLRVDGDPQTRIYVGGRFVGTAGDSQRSPIPISVPPGAETPYEGTAEVRLDRPGSPSYSASVTLRAGGEVTIAEPSAEVPP